MPANDLVALDANFARWQKTRGAGLKGFNLFDYYCIENFLKSFPVSDKEIQSGLVDNTADGGVDGFYFFANRKYVFDDTVLDEDADYKINLVIFQCKSADGFSPVAVAKLKEFCDDLLNLSRKEQDYALLYHAKLKSLMRSFKEQYARVAGSVGAIDVQCIYVSKLDVDEPDVDSDVGTVGKKLIDVIKKHFPKATASINFAGAAKLFEQASLRKQKSKPLVYSSQTIQTDEGWIGLVDLRSFYKFLSDEHGAFHEEMLEENVRGFQMKTSVNDSIEATLRSPETSAEFWVLNNGITILAKEITPGGHFTVTIKDPQIVNGLQTSRKVFQYYKSTNGGSDTDKRKILVRIINTTDEAVRDQIIRATNSQNKMPPEALRATDEIHRRVEEVFIGYGLYYDRRKGYYKDQGKPASRIVSVRDVLQATLAIALQQPHDARGRPADYLKDDAKYKQVFQKDALTVTTYLRCTELVRLVAENEPGKYASHSLNLIFYAALIVACVALKSAHATDKLIAKLRLDKISTAMIDSAYEAAYKIYVDLGSDDKAAKSSDMRDRVVAFLNKEIHGGKVV